MSARLVLLTYHDGELRRLAIPDTPPRHGADRIELCERCPRTARLEVPVPGRPTGAPARRLCAACLVELVAIGARHA